MSFHSHSKTPSVIPAAVATSPKYNMSGIANEINAMKERNGYMSTLFGRPEKGVAGRDYSKIIPDKTKKSTSSIFSA